MEFNWLESFRNVKEEKSWTFELKEFQCRVIDDLIKRKNVLAVFPTGFGKTFTFTTTPLILDSE
jgi:superfamily II DNA or RNA helicase